MGRSLSTHGGNDDIQTPVILAKQIVEHFKPSGRILEPCCGDGNFLSALPEGTEWCEIKEGKDFLDASGHWDWIITNPPYSIYRDFLNKSMEVSDNVVFLQLVNASFYKARLRDMVIKGFRIKEIYCIDTPREFPQFGFQMGCIHYKRDYIGDIKFILSKSMIYAVEGR